MTIPKHDHIGTVIHLDPNKPKCWTLSESARRLERNIDTPPQSIVCVHCRHYLPAKQFRAWHWFNGLPYGICPKCQQVEANTINGTE